MEKKRLGNSDLLLSPVGIGAWAMGGSGWAFSWSQQDDRDSIAAIHAALDAGMNWIDTAAVYGLGHSERVVAAALAEYSGTRPYVFTKCERAWDSSGQILKSLKSESIRRECEDSLRRLNVETIDLYQIHWPEPVEDIEEGWNTLLDLQRQGKVRWIGVSNFDVPQMERALALGPITSLQPPYSLIRSEVAREILPFANRHGIGTIVYSPMGSGMLAGSMNRLRVESLPADDWRRRSAHFQEPLLTRNLGIAAHLAKLAESHGRKPGEVAIAYTLANPAVTGAIVGFRNATQVRDLCGALTFRLSQSEVDELDRFTQRT
jgi:aryl-alcohol dehydrogenase-like predicted oxidoreductase